MQEQSPELRKKAIAAKLNGKPVDLSHKLKESGELRFVLPKTLEALEIIRHSTSHLMAHAVSELFPETQVAIGPVIEDGFYYDFKRSAFYAGRSGKNRSANEGNRSNKIFPSIDWNGQKRRRFGFYREKEEPMKVEIIEEKGGDMVSLYKQNGFIDLCLGPHVPSTGKLGSFKLLHTAGAYWKGDEKNPMLQRIYGTAWFRTRIQGIS